MSDAKGLLDPPKTDAATDHVAAAATPTSTFLHRRCNEWPFIRSGCDVRAADAAVAAAGVLLLPLLCQGEGVMCCCRCAGAGNAIDRL